jgi:hypothetical protein
MQGRQSFQPADDRLITGCCNAPPTQRRSGSQEQREEHSETDEAHAGHAVQVPGCFLVLRRACSRCCDACLCNGRQGMPSTRPRGVAPPATRGTRHRPFSLEPIRSNMSNRTTDETRTRQGGSVQQQAGIQGTLEPSQCWLFECLLAQGEPCTALVYRRDISTRLNPTKAPPVLYMRADAQHARHLSLLCSGIARPLQSSYTSLSRLLGATPARRRMSSSIAACRAGSHKAQSSRGQSTTRVQLSPAAAASCRAAAAAAPHASVRYCAVCHAAPTEPGSAPSALLLQYAAPPAHRRAPSAPATPQAQARPTARSTARPGRLRARALAAAPRW